MQELISIRRSLIHCEDFTSEESGVNCGELASHLLRLYTCLCDVDKGKDPEVLEAVKYTLEFYRELVNTNPYALGPVLAKSLRESSVLLHRTEMYNEALLAGQISVDIYRKLASIRQDTFGFPLAETLYAISSYLYDAGKGKEALNTLEEIVELCRKLMHEQSIVSTSDRTDLSYMIFTRLQVMRNLPQEATIFMRKSVEILIEVKEPVSTYNSTLTRSLRILSNCLRKSVCGEDELTAIIGHTHIYKDLGKTEVQETLAAFQESVYISRDFDQSRLDLLELLTSLSGRLGAAAAGRRDEALVTTIEAAKTCKELKK